MRAPKPLSYRIPPELSDGLPEALTQALIAPDFQIDAVLDEYLRAIEDDASEAWQNADGHAFIIAYLLLAKYHQQRAITQLLKGRIRERIRVVHG